MNALEERLGYTFQDKELLYHALTHSSYANEHRGAGLTSNERLEFLGDSVLGMVVADYLYHVHPDTPEGELTRTRAALVREGSLHEAALTLDLGSYLRLGRGEDAGGGRKRPSLLADAMEAVLAAIYLDGGIEPTRNLIKKLILDREGEKTVKRGDYKTALQELVQQKKNQVLSYALAGESGPDHDKQFRVEVSLNGQVVGEGIGSSKKRAEQAAAKAAMEALFPNEV